MEEACFPFFPNSSGNAVSKSTVVCMIEMAAEQRGKPLVTKDGRRAFGGHAFRVGGSRHLAALGVAISVIMLMARWGSDVVMHYLRDSPLAALTSQYVNLAASSKDHQPTTAAKVRKQILNATDKKKLDDLASASAEHDRAIEELRDKVKDIKPVTKEPPYLVSLSGGWHETLSTEGLPTSAWKTKGCGWRYGSSQIRRESTVPGDIFYKLICDRCLPALRKEHEARQEKTKGVTRPVDSDGSELDL